MAMSPEQMYGLGVGTDLLGGLLGGVISGDAVRDVARANSNASREAGNMLERDWNAQQQYYGGLAPEQYGAEVNSRYNRLGELANQALPELGNFDASQYNTQDFLNPYLDYQADFTRKQFEAGSAGRGAPRGGAYDTALAQRMQNMAGNEYWNNAQGAMQDSRNFGYKSMVDKYNSMLANAQNQYKMASDMYGNATGRANTMSGLKQNYGSAQINNMLDTANQDATKNNAMQMMMGQTVSGLSKSIGQGLAGYGSYQMGQQGAQNPNVNPYQPPMQQPAQQQTIQQQPWTPFNATPFTNQGNLG